MICDEAHTALGEKTSAAIRSLPRAGLHRHDGDRAADREAGLGRLPRLGRRPAARRRGPARPDRAAALPARAAGRGDQLGADRRRRLRGARPGRGPRPLGAEPGGREPLPRPLRLRRPGSSTRPASTTPTTSRRSSAPPGIKAEAVSGRDAARASSPRRSPPTSAARSTSSSTRSCSPRAGTRRARPSACTSRRPRRAASTSSASAGSCACTRARRRASSSTSSRRASTHNDRVISLHSLLDADFYREGARVTPAPRRRQQRRARRQLSPAPWLVPGHARRRAPARRDPARVAARRPEVPRRRRAALLGARSPAARSASTSGPTSSQKFTEGRAGKGALETVPRRLRGREPEPAAADDGARRPRRRRRSSAPTSTTSSRSSRQAPPWEKDRAAGRPHPAARDRRGQGGRARPDPRPLDVEARARDAQGAGPPRQRRVPGGEAPARRARQLARPPARGERRRSSSRSRARCRSPVGAALLASADGYTPRANALLDQAREELGRDPGDRDRARRQPARAEGAGAEVAPPARKKRRPAGAAAPGAPGRRRLRGRRRASAGRRRSSRSCAGRAGAGRARGVAGADPGDRLKPGAEPRADCGARPGVAALALAQELRQLGRERLARGQVVLVLEQLVDRVGAPLELLDVRLRLGVGGDGLADLLGVGLLLPPRARAGRSRPRAARRGGRTAPSRRAGSARARRSAAPPTTGSRTGSRPCGRRRAATPTMPVGPS